MRLAYIAAGAAGMYCGTCIHDNTLAAALQRRGCQVALVPTYTPLRTDEQDVSLHQVFYGGINVYLQQKSALFRHTPRFVDWLLDRPGLLKSLSRFSTSTSARDLGELTVSVLRGEEGRQGKELKRLIDWLAADFHPDVVLLTNSMFAGMARPMKRALHVPVLCALAGEDIFLEGLVEPYRQRALTELRRQSASVDGFIAPCNYYADYMAPRLAVSRDEIHVVPLGLSLEGHGQLSRPASAAPTIGYLARICPEKGLHQLVEAFHLLIGRSGFATARLAVAGYLGRGDEPSFDQIKAQVETWGLAERFRYVGEVDRQEKIHFLAGLDVFSVPTAYREPKGLFLLEALANGVPVVQPRHGAFPELVAATGGGLLVEPDSAAALAEGLAQLLGDSQRRQALGRAGQTAVHRDFNDEVMAENTLAVLRQYEKG